jgi:hypothetical protein
MSKFSNTNTLDHTRKLSYNAFSIVGKYLQIDSMRRLLLSLFALGIGGFIINIGQPLYMQNIFGTTGAQYGIIMAAMGVIMAINLALLIPTFWTKRFSNTQLIWIAHITTII